MNLSEHIEDVRRGIETVRYGNESAVSQGIVLRLLQSLGWPVYNTAVVYPEFSLEQRRVDYALCHPPNKPIAFIEVKQIGKGINAERQLFEYAFHMGIQLAILTDGQEWNFFLPAEQGDYTERRVYSLDIVERDLDESVSRLKKYLSYTRVISGEAIASARDDYQGKLKGRQIHAALPEALKKLVKEEDETLLELVADRVESLCGFKPDLDTVSLFLQKNMSLRSYERISSKQVATKASPRNLAASTLNKAGNHQIITTDSKNKGRMGYSFRGSFTECRNGRQVLISTLMKLAEHDPNFLERFAALPRHGKKRRYLAHSPSDLYPGRPDLAQEYSYEIQPGWHVGTNYSRKTVEKIIEKACQSSQFQFGKDLVVHFDA